MKVDWVIVGAGFAGCTIAERIATQLNQRVILVDKRNHIGGNAYDYHDEHGVLVHKYGPHIFHTNSKRVWDYLSNFTEWRLYYHHVLGVIDGKKVPLPFNINTIYQLFSPKLAEKLESLLVETYGFNKKVPILEMRKSTNPDLAWLAEFIYKNVFESYTAKQWELKPEDLSPHVTGRVPVVIGRDDRYFQDTYQAMPKLGYTRMFERMTAHKNIHVLLNTDYHDVAADFPGARILYTGPIDRYFDYMHGQLPYRSLRFELQTLDQEKFQEVGTVNYPNDHDFTRITEQKYLTGQTLPKTTLVVEYPQKYVPGENDPYYPIPRDENRQKYEKYLQEVKKLEGKVLFAGRLGDYQYYNMDQVVARALTVFDNDIAGKKQ